MAKVTIAVPCHNEEEFLEITLRSLMAQTEREIEIIVCDNASTDRTPEIAEALAGEDGRIQLAPSPSNIGGRRNFLRAFALGEAPVFMWAGAHDLFAPQFVEKLLEALERDKDAVAAFCDSGLVGRDGKRDPDDQVYRLPDLSQSDVVERYRRIVWSLSRCVLLHGLMRRERIDIGPLERVKELPDMAFLPTLALAGTIARVPELLFHMRLSRGHETREENEAHLIEDGYVEKGADLRDGRWASVRDSLCDSIRASDHPRSAKSTMIEATNLCFAKRFRVPWNQMESASLGEKAELAWNAMRGRKSKRLLRGIEKRLLDEHLPRDFGGGSIDKRLEVLLAESKEEGREVVPEFSK